MTYKIYLSYFLFASHIMLSSLAVEARAQDQATAENQEEISQESSADLYREVRDAEKADSQDAKPEQDTSRRTVHHRAEIDDSLYKELSYEELINLYWYLDMYDPENYEALDTFIMINDCDLYEQFYGNEFEWNDLRKAGKSYVSIIQNSYDPHFIFKVDVPLERYNDEIEGFPFKDNFLSGLKEIDIVNNKVHTVCRKTVNEIFPDNIIVRLPRTLYLPFLPMSEERARDFLQERYIDTDGAGRVVYMKIYFTIYKLLGQGFNREVIGQRATVEAQIDKIEFYSDPEYKNLIHVENKLY